MIARTIIFITAVLLAGCSHYITTIEVTTDNYDSGKLFREKEVSTRKYTKFDLHTHYTKVTTVVTEYHENGMKKLEWEQVWKNASWGKPCREVLYKEKRYNEKGTLVYEEKRECDQHSIKLKEYNDAGQLVYRKETWNSYGEQGELIE